MTKLPLHFFNGHLFLETDGNWWLFDTGAPSSFGSDPIVFEGQEPAIPSSYMGLSAVQLSGFVGRPTSGIIGADILNNFDLLIDAQNGRLTLSKEEVTLEGEVLPVSDFMGIPRITAKIGGEERTMFFDTGAQISYFQDESLETYPAAGLVTDFFPGIGQFETKAYLVNVELGGGTCELRCGSLPGLLGMTLMMAGVEGIIGNEILKDRVAGYFPRRRMLVLG